MSLLRRQSISSQTTWATLSEFILPQELPMTLLSLMFSLTQAHAVPVQLTQQGRLLDSGGTAINGLHLMTFRLYDSQVGGSVQWEESLQVGFTEGYYMAQLGANTASYPLEDSVLAGFPLYMEVEIAGSGPIGTRQPVVSTPYARISGTATHLSGGNVEANTISVGGQLVIDTTGSWVGPTLVTTWGDIQGVPADLADGDDDTLAGMSCTTGEIVGWNGTTWACAADNGLTETEVESFVTNGPLDLGSATTLGGLSILTEGNSETLSGLACQNGDVAKYDTLLGWQCDVDDDTTDWTALSNVPADLADGDHDTVLSESDVENHVTNGLGFCIGFKHEWSRTDDSDQLPTR